VTAAPPTPVALPAVPAPPAMVVAPPLPEELSASLGTSNTKLPLQLQNSTKGQSALPALDQNLRLNEKPLGIVPRIPLGIVR
jgi:hypothetical protein